MKPKRLVKPNRFKINRPSGKTKKINLPSAKLIGQTVGASSTSLIDRHLPLPYAAPLYDQKAPPGLGYLSTVFEVYMEPSNALIDVFTGWHNHQKFVIKNNIAQPLYYVVNKSLDYNILDYIWLDEISCIALNLETDRWNKDIVWAKSAIDQRLGSVQNESTCMEKLGIFDETGCHIGLWISRSGGLHHSDRTEFYVFNHLGPIGTVATWSAFDDFKKAQFRKGTFCLKLDFNPQLEIEQKCLLIVASFVVNSLFLVNKSL